MDTLTRPYPALNSSRCVLLSRVTGYLRLRPTGEHDIKDTPQMPAILLQFDRQGRFSTGKRIFANEGVALEIELRGQWDMQSLDDSEVDVSGSHLPGAWQPGSDRVTARHHRFEFISAALICI